MKKSKTKNENKRVTADMVWLDQSPSKTLLSLLSYHAKLLLFYYTRPNYYYLLTRKEKNTQQQRTKRKKELLLYL